MIKFTKIFPETIPGLIIAWPSSISLPDDEMFLECNGAVLTLSDRYTPLYNLIGNMYGGDPGTSFGLPDYSDRYLRGRSTTFAVGDIGESFVGYHTHTSSSSPPIAASDNVNNVGGWMAAGALSNTQVIAESRGPVAPIVGADMKPKTMYVKYYISY